MLATGRPSLASLETVRWRWSRNAEIDTQTNVCRDSHDEGCSWPGDGASSLEVGRDDGHNMVGKTSLTEVMRQETGHQFGKETGRGRQRGLMKHPAHRELNTSSLVCSPGLPWSESKPFSNLSQQLLMPTLVSQSITIQLIYKNTVPARKSLPNSPFKLTSSFHSQAHLSYTRNQISHIEKFP